MNFDNFSIILPATNKMAPDNSEYVQEKKIYPNENTSPVFYNKSPQKYKFK